MSEKGSVFQKGGGGTNYEQYVQSAFLTTLIIRGNAPGIPANEIIEVAFQTTNRGYETDDLLVVAKSNIGIHRLLIQIKHNITFSLKDVTFKEVNKAFWKDYNNTSIFDKSKDRLLIIKSGLTIHDRNHLKTLLNWAKTHATESDFISEVNRIKAKKEQLEVLRECLKEANNNVALSDNEIWEYLKCFDIIEYDFLNEASVDETYLMNLIKICKNDKTTLNEKEIWDSILVHTSKLNKDGGSVDIKSIPNNIISYFDIKKISPYSKSVEKLKNDSGVLLNSLKNNIHGFKLERSEIIQNILESINEFNITIVTGKPGVGKSAAVKHLLENDLPQASIIVFRADQFNMPHLANVLSSQGVNESIQDIFSCLSLIPDKIIVIDSLEKLLEGDPDNAFKQLISVLKEYPDIKLVGTARKYAVDLIIQKFNLSEKELSILEVPSLSEEEIVSVVQQFPLLNTVLTNDKIKKLLQSPKYLDFAITSLEKNDEDFSNISITEFKDKLWDSLVKDITKRTMGMSAKREAAFMDIAIKRAKEMILYVTPGDVDLEAIELLENDEIIFQEDHNSRYSPSHDILEDWALVKFISKKYEVNNNPKEFFNSLGNEPAIRRAFRLWIEDYIIDHKDKINDLISATLGDSTIEKYWADELLISIFKADNCATFFQSYEKILLADGAIFLYRCIHLIKTTCKERKITGSNDLIPIPIGSGWQEIILFIQKKFIELNSLRPSIVDLLLDWQYKLIFNIQIEENEILAAKNILIHFISQIEDGDVYWKQELTKSDIKNLIRLLYMMSNVAKLEITALIERALKFKEEGHNWDLDSFYSKVIDNCLSGLSTQNLTKELPELVIKTAWHEWKPKISKDNSNTRNRYLSRNTLSDEERWGIVDKHSFFPSGIYKTPVYNLLWYSPDTMAVLKFIVEFVNYSIEFYVNADIDYKHNISEIEIELNDGTIIKQWAAVELWGAYRGHSVTHYAIESILMSLEKFLLELADIQSQKSKNKLKSIYNYLLRNSNNVAVTGVLASIAIAYPKEVEEEMIPLFTVKEFYFWDLARGLHESTPLATMDFNIPFALDERLKSNQLPHRKKYLRGMRDFIVDYQFNIRTLNERLFKVFDKLEKNIDENDIRWRKTLSEIDIREYEIGPYDEKLGGIIIQPKYTEEVIGYLDSNKEEFDAHNLSLSNSSLIINAYEGKNQITFLVWEDCFNQYLDIDNLNMLYDRPITLAVLGLKIFGLELNHDQKTWCLETLTNAVNTIIQDSLQGNFDLNPAFNLMEKTIALKSFHWIINNLESQEDKDRIIVSMIQMLYAPFNEHEINKIAEYIRNEFFLKCPNEGKKVWSGLIHFAQFRKSNPIIKYQMSLEENNDAVRKEQEFIINLTTNTADNINSIDIDFEKFEAYILVRSLLITPYYFDDNRYLDYILHIIPLITEDLKLKEDYNYNINQKGRQIRFALIFDIKYYFAELLLNSNIIFSQKVIDALVIPILKQDIEYSKSRRNDLIEFSSNIPELVILKLDECIANSTDESLNNKMIDSFWKVWDYLFSIIKEDSNSKIISSLLLNIEWKPEATYWRPLNNKKEFYHKMVSALGKNHTLAIVNVLSTIGDKTLLPEGISWLVKIYQDDMNSTTSLISPLAERMIQRLYYNHMSTIKKNKILIDDYIWILNRMIDLGSSEAFLFRENVITYK